MSSYRLGICIGFLVIGVVVAELELPQESWYEGGGVQLLSISGQNSTAEITMETGTLNLLEWDSGQVHPSLQEESTGVPISWVLPSLMISEVFFDGSDEWIEITNHWNEAFSGAITLSGNGVHVPITGFWLGQEPVIIGRNSRTYPYIQDLSAMKYIVAMSLTDTKAISLDLRYQNQIIDSFFVDTGTVLRYNDKNTSLERNLEDQSITWTSISRTRNVISGYFANPGIYLPEEIIQDPQQGSWANITGSLSPTWRITEVYADPDSWIELTNIGSSLFSGNVVISGFSEWNMYLPVRLLASQSKVYAQQGNQIQDSSVIALSGIAWQHDPNKRLHIQAYDQFWGQDEFIVDERYMKKYSDYNISFEKVGEGNAWITTKTTLDRRYNNRVGFVVNPGKVYATGENLERIDLPPPAATWIIPLPPVDCQTLSTDDSVHVSELFLGNDAYRSFIEIEVNDDIDLSNIILSGSLLEEEIGRTIADDLDPGEKNTIRLISSDKDWYNKWLDTLDNPRLSVKKTPGRLAIYVMSGQNRQLMDIVYSIWGNTGQSLYYGGKTQSCGRIFDETGDFSPGFKKTFLDYFAVSTSPKIEYITIGNAIAGSCPLLPRQDSALIKTTGIQVLDRVTPQEPPKVDILSIEYDPPWADTNQEKIQLLLSTGNTVQQVFLGTKDWFLKINGTKKYLTGMLLIDVPQAIQGTFGFPNSSKTGQAISIQLRYLTSMVAQYAYVPLQQAKVPKTKLTTGETIEGVDVVEVIDGDTLKVRYEGKEQNVRFLWIDAPEISLLRNKKKGCFAQEAKTYLQSLIQGKSLRLVFDPTQQKSDAYKRRLVYVYVDDFLVNKEMLAQWFAKEYTFKTPYQQRDLFVLAQQDAQEKQKGLWNLESCPENIFTGQQEMSGKLMSPIQGSLLALLPNPKGKDILEGIRLLLHSQDTGEQEVSGVYLNIKGKKKRLPWIPLDQEILLTGNFTLPNTAACIDLALQDQPLDTLCYEKPKEDKRYTSDGEQATQLSNEEENLLDYLQLAKQGNELCMMYKDLKIWCRTIPSTKTATKTKWENKLYEWFIGLIDQYLKDNWKELYYTPQLQTFFSLFHADKQGINKWEWEISSSHGPIQVYDIGQQILLLETYSLVYRAKLSAQLGQSSTGE